MKKVRNIVCGVLALVLLLSAMPVTAHGAEFAHGNSCTFCKNCDRLITFDNPVHRIYGNTRYETGFAIADTLKAHLGVDLFRCVVVASGSGFADALAGSFLAGAAQAPILLANDGNEKAVKNYIKSNLAPGGKVYILGGTAAVSESMEKGLEDYSMERLWGETRYETNLAILNEAGVGTEDILICTGKGFADSLSASALGMPILLVGDSLTDSQKEFLSGRMINNKIIIGGVGAVSQALEQELRDLSYSSAEIMRIGGNDRFETSVLVAGTFFSNANVLTLAYARNFPDGLCGGPLAYLTGMPLILTATGKEAEAAAFAKENHSCWGYVLGGTKLISDKAAKKIFVPRNDNQGGDYENYDFILGTDALWQEHTPEVGPFEIRSFGDIPLLTGTVTFMDYSYPEDPARLTWATSNPEVVMVGTNGLIYTLSEGTAVIRASDGTQTRYCEVQVVEKHTPEQKKAAALVVAQQIADNVMSDTTLKTDMERITKASYIVHQFIKAGHYSTFHEDYNSAYGTFVAGYSSCAGGTRAMGLVLECMGFEWYHVNENQWDHQWCVVYDMDGQEGFADPDVYGIAGYGDRETATWYSYDPYVGVYAR